MSTTVTLNLLQTAATSAEADISTPVIAGDVAHVVEDPGGPDEE